MIPSSSPNAEQKRFMNSVRDIGSIVSGYPAVVHHAAGRAAKHNKVHIGHYWLLPLTDEEHKLLHSDKDEFEREALGFVPVGRWDCEKLLFLKVLKSVDVDIEPHVIEAILDYRR